MLTEFWAMWDEHLGEINVAKHRIGPLENTAKTVHMASYRAGQRKREFENVEIDKMRARKAIEAAQTELGSTDSFCTQ